MDTHQHMGQALLYALRRSQIVYKLCDKKRINTTDLNSFLTKSQEYSFSDKLFNTLSARGINENNFTNYPIRQLVVEELEKYYDWMETM